MLRRFHTELAGAIAAYGAMSQVISPEINEPKGASGSAAWERAADEMTGQLQLASRALAEGIARSRVTLFMQQAEGISASLPKDSASPDRTGDLGDSDQLTKLLGRLPTDSTADALSRCESLAQQWRRAKRGTDRVRVEDALRLVVQQQRDRADLIGSNGRRVEALYRELDGLKGEAVETLRGLLKGTALDSPIPPGLEERVRQVSVDASGEEDRRFALETVAGIFSELGYKVEDEFVTVVPEEGLLLELPGSRAHGLLVRERGHQLLLNVVRHSEAGPRDPRSDTAAEEHFCKDLAKAQESLAERGVQLDLDRLDPPGKTPVQVLPSVDQSSQRRRRKQPPIERARDRP